MAEVVVVVGWGLACRLECGLRWSGVRVSGVRCVALGILRLLCSVVLVLGWGCALYGVLRSCRLLRGVLLRRVGRLGV